MGQVFRATDTRLGRTVAIKISKSQFGERFEREAKAISALNHPHICTLYDVGPNYLVMELVEGESPKGPMAFDDAWKIALQTAEALEYAHEKGVVHCDLKPANIKVTPDGVVKLLDFGLAKAFTGQREASPSADENSPMITLGPTEPGVILGTAAYMAPEQARGKKVDKRADIWSWGVVLYELLTGGRMFKGEDVADTLAQVLTREPDLGRVPAKVRKLLVRCLEKDPKQRLRDIGEARFLLAEEPHFDRAPADVWRLLRGYLKKDQRLRSIEAAEYLLESGAGSLVQATSPFRRFPWFLAAALAIVDTVLGLLYVRQTQLPAQPLTRFRVDLGPDAVAGFRVTTAISPDGRRLAFVARGASGREQLATRLLEQTNYTLLPGTENATDPFFSPDGQWVGFFADGKMKKISVQEGAAVTLCNAPNDRGASWGEDGNIIATLDLTKEPGLSRVPETGGSPQPVTKPSGNGEGWDRWPQILPGGQTVLLTATATPGAYDTATIYALSLKTGQRKAVQRGGYFGRYLPSGHLVYVHLGTLLAVPFDLDRLEVRGVPVPLLEDVAADAFYGAGQFSFSRTGTFVYLSGKSFSGPSPISFMDSDGKLQALVAAQGKYFTPRFSPDGRRLAFAVALNTIQVYDRQRDAMTRLTFNQGISSPVWTPDGNHIAFETVNIDGSTSLWWIRSDGARERRKLLDSKNSVFPYSFSPDGSRLAYAEEPSRGLWTLPLDLSDPEHPKPGQPEPFLKTPAPELEPAFSPDGRWIAYQSQEAGVPEIEVRPFPGPGAKWLVSTMPAVHPIWSRNARELLFESANDKRIWVATYTANGDTFIPGKPRVWSERQIVEPSIRHWNLDLTPDGKRFAVFPTPDAGDERKGSVHVTVLLNFFDELRRRVPAGK